MINVMIVEDDPMVREINSKFLGRIDGFELYRTAGSVKEAKCYAAEAAPDLILLDVYLPGENGLEFLKWLRKEEIDCDVILITADKNMDSVQEALRYGAMDYLIKPFTFERFKESLTKYKSMKSSFESLNEIEQETVDRHIFSKRDEHGSHEDLAKGLNTQTYDKIWAAVRTCSSPAFSAEEIAELLGMARVTVRRYLDYMQKEGALAIEIEYGKVGRPQHKYKAKSK